MCGDIYTKNKSNYIVIGTTFKHKARLPLSIAFNMPISEGEITCGSDGTKNHTKT